MRPERNPLDLNNLPEDFTRDGKQILEDSSSSAAAGGGYRKKKSGGKDDCGKVYECRFCSLKFCKSQALGGHMNRHRQERETETLNRARQLVFNNDNLIPPPGPHHLGGQPIAHGGYHQTGNIGDATLPFRSVYPTRLFSGSSSTILTPPPPPPPPQSYIYPSPSRLVSSYSTHYNTAEPINDYFVGHVLQGNTQYPNYATAETNYTCIGAPVGPAAGFTYGKRGPPGVAVTGGGSGGGGGGRDMSLNSNQPLDPSSINRYQDGF